MHRAHEDLQTLEASWENRMIPAHVVGPARDATIEVHLFVAPVAVHASGISCLACRERLSTELFQSSVDPVPPSLPGLRAGVVFHRIPGKTCRAFPWELIRIRYLCILEMFKDTCTQCLLWRVDRSACVFWFL
eukprot:4058296-Amphidinium_carterae.1